MLLTSLFSFQVSDLILEFLDNETQKDLIDVLSLDIEVIPIKSTYDEYLCFTDKQRQKIRYLQWFTKYEQNIYMNIPTLL
jgi:hypothetical protein